MKVLGETKESIVSEGTLAECRRMAFSLGLEVDRYEGTTISCDGGKAIMTTATADNYTWCHFKQGGFIVKGAHGTWCLVVRK